MKKIGVDARFYGEAGPGRYTKAIIQHLEKLDTNNQYLIFLRKRGMEEYAPKNPNFIKIAADFSWYSFKEQTLFLIMLLKYQLDLLYVPHFNVPVLYPKRLVTAIPDVIMHYYSTKHDSTRSALIYGIKRLAYKFTFWSAVKRSEKIIVPSISAKNDFLKYYKNLDEDRFVLAYEGVDPDFLKEGADINTVREKYSIKKPYLLYVGSAYRHKNLPRLLEAIKILKNKYGFSGQLVIVGKKDYFSTKLAELVKRENLEADILLPGLVNYVSDKEIIALRKNALLYVFPSLMEGFSLTPMEAQAANLPAVISDIPLHREIYGDSVEYFNPEDPAHIAEKINEVLNSGALREELVRKGKLITQKFSWDKTAKITFEVFGKLLQSD
jgi:glycosyltransferase involved in cell wall biosynthesis